MERRKSERPFVAEGNATKATLTPVNKAPATAGPALAWRRRVAVMDLPFSLAAFGARVVAKSRGRQTADRALLEGTILPAYATRCDVRRVLFVGCASFTAHYAQLFAGVEYWTIDPSAHRRRWGAPRHILGRLEHLADHVPAEYFDVIVCNGVLGWGLNRRADAELAFAACFYALRPGGELVVGWNDVWPRNRVRPEGLQAVDAFEAVRVPGHDETRLRVPGFRRHIFEAYRKPDGRDGAGFSRAPSARSTR